MIKLNRSMGGCFVEIKTKTLLFQYHTTWTRRFLFVSIPFIRIDKCMALHLFIDCAPEEEEVEKYGNYRHDRFYFTSEKSV